MIHAYMSLSPRDNYLRQLHLRMSKHAVVDSKPSTPAEIHMTKNLHRYCDVVAPLEVSTPATILVSTRI